MDVMVVSEMKHFDATNISQADIERLKSLLPQDLQDSGNLTQLEIVIQAIHYIKLLQSELGSPSYF